MARDHLALPGRFLGAVFDFDGLLVDSEPGWGRAEERLLARHGQAMTDEDRVATVGRSMEQSIATYAARLKLAPEAVPALRAEMIELAAEEYRAGFALQPGAGDLLALLRPAMPIALASNTGRMLIDLALATTPFASSFDAIVTADDVQRHKPAPDLYLLACERLAVRPSDAVAFEDSAAGVRSARAAGLTVVAVPVLPGPDFDIADVVVPSLAELVRG